VVKRIVVGIVLTVLLLALARMLSTRRPREIIVEREGFVIQHRTVTEQVGPGKPVVVLKIDKFIDIIPKIMLRSSTSGVLRVASLKHTGFGRYEFTMANLGRGERFEYAFRIDPPLGGRIRIPEQEDGFFLLKFKGEVSKVVLVLHIILMFGSFYFMIQSLFGAVSMLRGVEGMAGTVSMVRGTLACLFVGGWPLGFILNYQAFGTIWEGFPFGYDITDNKTQVIFLFWLVTALLVRGSLFGGNRERDRLGERGFAVAVIVSFAVSMLLFLVPHSL
jgi:hypothetical protein